MLGGGVMHKNPVGRTESELLIKQGRGPLGDAGGHTSQCCLAPFKLLGI